MLGTFTKKYPLLWRFSKNNQRLWRSGKGWYLSPTITNDYQKIHSQFLEMLTNIYQLFIRVTNKTQNHWKSWVKRRNEPWQRLLIVGNFWDHLPRFTKTWHKSTSNPHQHFFDLQPAWTGIHTELFRWRWPSWPEWEGAWSETNPIQTPGYGRFVAVGTFWAACGDSAPMGQYRSNEAFLRRSRRLAVHRDVTGCESFNRSNTRSERLTKFQTKKNPFWLSPAKKSLRNFATKDCYKKGFSRSL